MFIDTGNYGLGIMKKLQGYRFLVIEDEPLEALLAAQIVKELGATEVTIANSIAVALSKLSSRSFDCVTLDLNMHGYFALGMAWLLKRQRIPFVFCTAYGDLLSDFEGIPVVENRSLRRCWSTR